LKNDRAKARQDEEHRLQKLAQQQLERENQEENFAELQKKRDGEQKSEAKIIQAKKLLLWRRISQKSRQAYANDEDGAKPATNWIPLSLRL
jgi:TolA-binding protein